MYINFNNISNSTITPDNETQSVEIYSLFIILLLMGTFVYCYCKKQQEKEEVNRKKTLDIYLNESFSIGIVGITPNRSN